MSLLGTYPTAVTELTRAADAAGVSRDVRVLCKRDDLTSAIYGGNKVRKLERLLDEARTRGAHKVVTVGAVGSHHVLATALFGRAAGFEVDAILAPQITSPHAVEVARVGATLGFTAVPVRSFAAVPIAMARRLRGRAYLIPPGGSSVTGSLAYVDAALELAGQIARGDLPRPSCIVVALGSGGTAAGLLAGLSRAGLLETRDGAPPVELVAVQVVDPPFASAAQTLSLALAIRRRLGEPLVRSAIATMSRNLTIARGFLGRGYGCGTPEGDEATAFARLDGIDLDPTYTAKAFAAALGEARARPAGSTVLYWHTLSAKAPFVHLLEHAPPFDALDPRIRGLFRGPETVEA